MGLYVARVPYLHYEPFYFDMERRGVELVELYPNQLADALQQGHVDAAPIPLAHCLHPSDQFDDVAGFGVACVRKAGSVVLASTAPIESLDGARIAVPDISATSSTLLTILLQFKYHVKPGAFVALEDPHDARLLIGDTALRHRRGIADFPYLQDLGELWQAWTGLPVVFSRWQVRRTVDSADKALLEDALYVGLEEGVNAMYQVTQPREDLLMLPRDIVRYIQAFRYYLGLAEQKSIDRFRRDVEAMDQL